METKSFGEVAITISDIVYEVLATKFLSERTHDEGVINAHGNDFISSFLFNGLGIADVLRDVGSHAGGSERAGVANKDDCFILEILLGLNLLSREAVLCGVETDNTYFGRGNNITNFD